MIFGNSIFVISINKEASNQKQIVHQQQGHFLQQYYTRLPAMNCSFVIKDSTVADNMCDSLFSQSKCCKQMRRLVSQT